MIKELRANHSVRLLCQVLEVARSGYHRWRRGPASARAVANERVVKQIKAIDQARRGNYGSPRITQELRQRGQKCNHKRVERLMRQEGLKGSTAKQRKVRTTNSEHDQPIAPNLLLNRPAPRKIDEVWVADITYLPTTQGWLYLAAVMDLYSRLILGWSLGESLQATGALQALSQALAQRGNPHGVIHHSDQGLQYACREYRQRLQRYGFLVSMSRRGNCYDNAAMEAFWSTLKREALQQSANWSKEQVRRVTFEYIESIYNRSRLHSSLEYRSPVDFEHQKN